MMKSSSTIDEYIATYPPEVQEMLQKVRNVIHKAAPEATEAIAYGIPTFKYKGKNLVHFGGYAKFISFYPTSSGIATFHKEISKYATSKGTVQFPLDQPLPYDLIEKITLFRVKEMNTQTK